MTEPQYGLRHLIDGALVAVVEIATPDGAPPRYHRKMYFSLKGAQSALERGRARGLHGEVHLCRLTPVSEVTTDEKGAA